MVNSSLPHHQQYVIHWVPQGSILDPFLFMNDLPVNITSNTDIYADDSSVHTNAMTVVELNCDMVNMKWCVDNNMAVNQDKSKAMLITTYQKATRLETKELNVTYDGIELQNVDNENWFGIKNDKDLSWKDQVDKVANKVSRGIG